jgi:hypothetical protein
MNAALCSNHQTARCATDKRRERVRATGRYAGLDYVEVDSGPNGTTLTVHFFGSVPEGLSTHNVVIEGGRRIRDIKVLSAQFIHHDDGDTCLHVSVDKPGDFSPYCICLIEPTESNAACLSDVAPEAERKIPVGIDPRYSCASFLFHTDCAATMDCKPPPCPQESSLPLPAIDYLARDFQSFRQLMLDRLLVTMPQWRERHIPDISITLVELLAYVADQLSYSLDAVATEAYLSTARLRISVRRHARLVDYRMHEGCNARAWVCIASAVDQTFELNDLAFAMAPNGIPGKSPGLVDWESMQNASGALIYEAIAINGEAQVSIVAAHSEIHFYTWEGEECCLPEGATRASLLDETIEASTDQPAENSDTTDGAAGHDCQSTDSKSAVEDSHAQKPNSATVKESEELQRSDDVLSGQTLKLKQGDVLILEEIRGPRTGDKADADPSKRHAVRLVRVTPTIDPVTQIRVLDVEWGREDALPFTLCLSARTDAPDCRFVETAVARGNVLLVDHGMTLEEFNEEWLVGVDVLPGCCGCEGAVIDQPKVARPFALTLENPMLTYAEALDPSGIQGFSASALLIQNPRKAVASIQLDDTESNSDSNSGRAATRNLTSNAVKEPTWRHSWDWISVPDLLSSRANDRHFVVEMDDEAIAHLRFGDGDCGRLPEPGLAFRARYRIGNGAVGNVGRDSILWMSSKNGIGSSPQLYSRNPLAAEGGTKAEPVTQVKLYAPHAYSRVIERAVAASDYSELANRDSRIQSAYAELAWTGSWYEANLALDPFEEAQWNENLAEDIEWQLQRARRIGHDLRVVPTRKVPLVIRLEVCFESNYSRSDVERAIRHILSNQRLANGQLGFFHPDRLAFGTDIKASQLIAAVQKLEGVRHVEIIEFRRLDTAPNKPSVDNNSFANNFISIRRNEIAQLDSDPNFPENGILEIKPKGGL